MNERIKELVLASGFSTDFIEDAQLKAAMQKFAELIVKECIELSKQDRPLDSYGDQMTTEACIKERFGG